MNMKRLVTYFPVLAAAFLFAGCDVHEFPEPEPPVIDETRISLSLEFDLSLPLFKELEYDPTGGLRTRASSSDDYRLRYIVQAFPAENGSGEDRVPLRTWTITRVDPASPDTTLVLDIPARTSRILVWTDVSDSDGSDLHYITDSFSEIRLPDRNNHRGATELRQAFRGDLQLVSGQTEGIVRMERPMAKYRFVTNDFDRFISNVARQRGGSLSGGAPDLAVALSDYYVRFIYPRYMASSLNMFTNRPADSWIGVTYTSSIRPIDGTQAEMGFDYVFVNTHETSVNVGLEVVEHSTGEVVARIPSIDIPLTRSKLTTVRGPFLTTKAEGGAGIDPDYDGDFDIEIK